MSLTENATALFADLKVKLQTDLIGFAAYAEEMARLESEGHWSDDSGSARASITAYSLNAEPSDKNFQAAEWAAAQSPGYTSPRWGNPASNFFPYETDYDPPSDVAVLLTMFVQYAEALEFGTPQEADHPLHARNKDHQPVIAGTLADTTSAVQGDFAQAVERSVADALR